MTDPTLEIKTAPGDRAAPPPVLLAYQQNWVADQAQLKVGEKARRIGLTWAEAADDALIAARADGSNVFYISATQDMALEYIEACAMWARAFDRAASEIEEGLFDDVGPEGDTRHIKTYSIHFPGSGRRIVGLSSAPRKLRGKQGVIVIDEAAFHQDLEALLKAAMAMLLWGDRVRVISTHDGDQNPFNELIEDIRAGKRKGSVHRITFREAVEQGLYRRVCLRRGITWTAEGEAAWVADAYAFYGEDAAEELDVVPSQGAGAYLARALIEARMNPQTPIARGAWPSEFALLPDVVRAREIDAWCEENLAPLLARLDPSRPHGFGEDFARVGDLTVIPVVAETQNLVRRVRLWVELSNCPFTDQERIVKYIGDRLPRFRSAAADATGNGAYLAERLVQRYGAARIEAVTLSDRFYLDHMPRFKAAFEDGTLTDIPRDSQILDDLRALRKIDGVPKLPKLKTQSALGGQKVQRHGDGAIGLFLAHYAMTREVAPIEFYAAPSKGSRWGDQRDDPNRAPTELDDIRIPMEGGW